MTEDSFSEELSQILQSRPEMQEIYDQVYSILGGDEEGEMEMDAYEIDGKVYLVCKEFIIRGITYVHLINEKDPRDFMYRKVSVEDGEEYLVGLDSEREFDMVLAYEQKYILRDLKRKQEWDASHKGE